MVIFHYPQPFCCLAIFELEHALRRRSPNATPAVPGASRALIQHSHR